MASFWDEIYLHISKYVNNVFLLWKWLIWEYYSSKYNYDNWIGYWNLYSTRYVILIWVPWHTIISFMNYNIFSIIYVSK